VKAWATVHKVDPKNIPFYVSDRPAQFVDEQSTLGVVSAIKGFIDDENVDPVLVIIDTLNRNFGPGDENSNAEMTKFINSIDEHIRTPYECAVLIVHHSGKKDTDHARGASALKGALDWEYKLKKNSDGTRILECTKVKDHEPPPSLTFKPEVVALDWIDEETGKNMTSCVLKRVANQTSDEGKSKKPSLPMMIALDSLIEAIKEKGLPAIPESNGSKVAHKDAWREFAYRKSLSTSDKKDAKSKAFSRAASALRKAKRIDSINDYWWPISGQNEMSASRTKG